MQSARPSRSQKGKCSAAKPNGKRCKTGGLRQRSPRVVRMGVIAHGYSESTIMASHWNRGCCCSGLPYYRIRQSQNIKVLTPLFCQAYYCRFFCPPHPQRSATLTGCNDVAIAGTTIVATRISSMKNSLTLASNRALPSGCPFGANGPAAPALLPQASESWRQRRTQAGSQSPGIHPIVAALQPVDSLSAASTLDDSVAE